MKEKITSHIQNCLKCISFSPQSGCKEGFVHSIPKGNVPFNVVHIDHFGPIDKARLCKQYILVIVDAFTKHVKLYATKTTTSSENIKYFTDYFSNFSKPKMLISDRGTCFTSKEFREFILEKEIKHVLIATGSPQENGQVECINRILTLIIAKLVDNNSGKY